MNRPAANRPTVHDARQLGRSSFGATPWRDFLRDGDLAAISTRWMRLRFGVARASFEGWRRSREQLALAGIGLIGLACASQQRPLTSAPEAQSYAAAIHQICDVDRLVEGAAGATELELGQLRQDFIVEHTKNPDAIFFVTVWRTKPPTEQSRLLQQEALEQKLPACALAKTLAQAAE